MPMATPFIKVQIVRFVQFAQQKKNQSLGFYQVLALPLEELWNVKALLHLLNYLNILKRKFFNCMGWGQVLFPN